MAKEIAAEKEIRQHEIVTMEIAKLQLDPFNPNVMTPRQEKALEESFKKYGYLYPVIVDRSTNMVADGEHRVKVYQKFGKKQIPCILLDFQDDGERRMLRQVMNKLHGEHDMKLDFDELAALSDADKLDELADLIGKDRESLNFVVDRHKEFVAGEAKELDVLPTQTKCPKCGYEW